jgi:hypothetical protein
MFPVMNATTVNAGFNVAIINVFCFGQANPRTPVNYEHLEHYVLVKDQIIRKATAPPHNLSDIDIENFLNQVSHKIHNHYNSDVQSFTEDEKKWLVERLCWEHFCASLSTLLILPTKTDNLQFLTYHPIPFPASALITPNVSDTRSRTASSLPARSVLRLGLRTRNTRL